MKIISLLLVFLGVVGLGVSIMMFGDESVAGGIGALAALFSGVGFWLVDHRLNPPHPKEQSPP